MRFGLKRQLSWTAAVSVVLAGILWVGQPRRVARFDLGEGRAIEFEMDLDVVFCESGAPRFRVLVDRKQLAFNATPLYFDSDDRIQSDRFLLFRDKAESLFVVTNRAKFVMAYDFGADSYWPGGGHGPTPPVDVIERLVFSSNRRDYRWRLIEQCE